MTYKLYLLAACTFVSGAGLAAWIPGSLHPAAVDARPVPPQYQFVVSPGEDPASVHFDLRDVQSEEVDASGALVLRLRVPEVWRVRPRAYQMLGAARREVPVQFAIDERGHVLFVPGSYDRNLPLILDPVVE